MDDANTQTLIEFRKTWCDENVVFLFVQVDLVMWGHVHNYERTCAVYESKCLGSPIKDKAGIDTYNSAKYTAPVHAVVGMAGFSLDAIAAHVRLWILPMWNEIFSKFHWNYNKLDHFCLVFIALTYNKRSATNCSEIDKEEEWIHLLQKCSRELNHLFVCAHRSLRPGVWYASVTMVIPIFRQEQANFRFRYDWSPTSLPGQFGFANHLILMVCFVS